MLSFDLDFSCCKFASASLELYTVTANDIVLLDLF